MTSDDAISVCVCSQVFCISQALPQLPLQIDDAMRPEHSEVMITSSFLHETIFYSHSHVMCGDVTGWTTEPCKPRHSIG